MQCKFGADYFLLKDTARLQCNENLASVRAQGVKLFGLLADVTQGHKYGWPRMGSPTDVALQGTGTEIRQAVVVGPVGSLIRLRK